MFHFPAYTPTQAMYSPAGHTTQLVRGFPIRTSSDQRFVGNSPRHNAASHVLHRPSMPRHPPYALDQQHTQTIKHILKHNKQEEITHKPNPTKTGSGSMLASTLQFSHTTPTHAPQPQTRSREHTCRSRHTQSVLPQTPDSMPTHTVRTLIAHPHGHTT